MIIKLWIARTKGGFKKGYLAIFENKPVYVEHKDEWADYYSIGIYINNEEFPEVTFENSPQQIEINMFDCNPPLDMNDYGYRCSAPTISQVLKWSRKKKNIHITIDITNYGFISSITSFRWDKSYCENEIEHYDHKGYNTYEEAAIAGIKYVLDNLIN